MMPPQSTRTTGNDPVEGADPGGTRSTRPGTPAPDKPGGARQTEQHVVSGDENADPPRRPGHQPEP